MLRASVGSYIFPILYEVQSCFTAIGNWLFKFLQSIFVDNQPLSELKPLFVIGIAVAVIFVAILLVKKVVWGK